MKISRRTAIKGISAGVATTIAPSAIASASRQASSHATDSLRVQLAHQWGKDGIAAVIKNTSGHSTTITEINSVAGDYGRFNFSELTKDGPVTLAAGEEVHVPFTLMGTPVNPYGHFDNRLQKKLRKDLKISTDRRVASVTTTMNPRIV